MTTIDRRRFLQFGTASAALAFETRGTSGAAATATSTAFQTSTEQTIRLSGDGLGLTPDNSVKLLGRLADDKGIPADSYSNGGVVEELEQAFARRSAKSAPSSCRPARWPTTWPCARSPAGPAARSSRPRATCTTTPATPSRP